jgi:hypothetical protein
MVVHAVSYLKANRHKMENLSYNLSVGNISVSAKEVEAIADSRVPTTQKELRSFM